jgi:hypothetical protein
MEEFLKEYVKTFLEMNDEEMLSDSEITAIVNRLQEDDEIWTTLDYYVDSHIADVKRKEK